MPCLIQKFSDSDMLFYLGYLIPILYKNIDVVVGKNMLLTVLSTQNLALCFYLKLALWGGYN